MKLEKINAIAKQHRIILGRLSKTELIKLIQACEKNAAFLSSAFAAECDQVGCAWRADCFDAALAGMRR